MNAQDIDESFLSLEKYLKEDQWDENVSRRLAGKIIGIGRGELRELELIPDGELGTVQEFKLRALQEAIGPYKTNLVSMPPAEAEIFKMEMIGRAKAAYIAVGRERMTLQWLIRRAEEYRENKIGRDENTQAFHSPFNNTSIRKAIALSLDQEEKILALLEQAKESLEGDSTEKTDLDQCVREHLVEFLEVLAAEKRQEIREIIGIPIRWFECDSKQTFLNRDFSRGSYRHVTKETGGKRLDDGRFIIDLPPPELADRGIDFMYGHVHEMLNSPFIWRELDCTASQQKQLTSKIPVLAMSGHHRHRLQEILLRRDVNYPDTLNELLNTPQIERLRCLEYQVLTNQFNSSFGLLHPTVVDHLDTNDDQIKKIKEIETRFRMQYKVHEKALLKDRNEIKLKLKKDLLKILTPEQSKIIKQFDD